VFFPAWPLTVVDREAAEVSIEVGTVLQSSDSITLTLTISNPDEIFTVAADGYIALKIDEEDPTACELVFLPQWPEDLGYQVTYNGTIEGEDFEFIERHFPLWKFVSESSDSSTLISEGIYAEQLCFNHLAIQYGIYRTPNGEFVQLPGFVIAQKAA